MPHHKITEQDLLHIFSTPKNKKKKIIIYFFSICAVLLASLVIYFVVNFNAFSEIIRYWYQSDIRANNNYSSFYPEAIVNIEENGNIETINNNLPSIPENHIFIPKINIKAPLTWQVENNETEIQKALEKGIVHLNGTALPGENGNVFVTGHSSNYLWAKGGYNNVFALLNKLVVGDLIYLNYNNKIFVYKTNDIMIVKPSELWVTESKNQAQLSLMTCTPIGTSINRYIVVSNQIFPEHIVN